MKTLILMMLEFFKTGLLSVGGGLATLPFLYEMSEVHGWFSQNDIADMIAVSESTPGAIGINMATYSGYHTCGIIGGILASLSLAAPSIIVILIVARILDRFRSSTAVSNAFYGLRPASIAMISAAGVNVARTALIDTDAFQASSQIGDLFLWKPIVLAVFLFLAQNQKKVKLHPVVYIGISAVIGVLFHFAG